jgi:hypothetical protein
MSLAEAEDPHRLTLEQTTQHMDSTRIVILIEPVGRHGKFRATLDGRAIVAESSTPLLDAARILIAWGYNPGTVLEMHYVGAAEAALTGPISVAARLDVKDAKFVRHRSRAEGRAKADASLTDRADGSGGN